MKNINPLKGETPKTPLDQGNPSKLNAKAKKMPELDSMSQELIRQTGMSDDAITAALNAE